MRNFGKAIIGGAVLLGFSAQAGRADGMGGGNGNRNSVRWQQIVGLAQAGNSVGGIAGGGQPWTTQGGQAYVDLVNNIAVFNVRGLVLAGGSAVGTPGPITAVKGTLVCGAGTTSQVVTDTAPVTLDAQGNAFFDGSFSASPAGCSPTNTTFLVRISSAGSNNNAWIANGAVRVP